MSLSKLEIDKLLDKEEIVFLSTCDLKGNPHIKPIWFVYHKGVIWFETHLPTRGLKILRRIIKLHFVLAEKELILFGEK